VRPKASTALLLLVAAASLAPAALHAVLASAAGTLFEATPFVLIASLADRIAHRLCPARAPIARRFAWVAGCGCGPLPGALTVPALALCWLGFGPALALARAGAALALARLGPMGNGRREEGGARPDEPLGQLAALVAPAVGGAVVSQALLHTNLSVPPAIGFIAGALLGALAPCAAGSVALASAFRLASPATAAGLLATAGLFAFAGRRRKEPATSGSRVETARLPAAALALACGLLAAHHCAGFLNPRLMPLVWLAAVLAATLAAAGSRPAGGWAAWVAPTTMLAALLYGSPSPPIPPASATSLDRAFPGEALLFAGVARHDRGSTTLVRFAITCCRADAAPVAVRLDRLLSAPDGAWVEADGVLASDEGGLVLRVAHARRTSPPLDPFVYR
jgi:hypothetical protein